MKGDTITEALLSQKSISRNSNLGMYIGAGHTKNHCIRDSNFRESDV